MKNIKFILFTIILFLNVSCTQNKNNTIENNIIENKITKKDTIKSISIKKDSTKQEIVFSKQDSIELYAIDGYYFGKMASVNIVSRGNTIIGGIDFGKPSNYFYGIQFQTEFRDENSIGYNFQFDDLIRIISSKYGTPKKTIHVNKEKFVMEHYLCKRSVDYTWKDKYKKIIIYYEFKDNSIRVITLEVINLKLERIYLNNEKNIEKNWLKNESKKL